MVHRTQPPMWGPLLLYTCLTPFSLSSLYMHLLSRACFSFRCIMFGFIVSLKDFASNLSFPEFDLGALFGNAVSSSFNTAFGRDCRGRPQGDYFFGCQVELKVLQCFLVQDLNIVKSGENQCEYFLPLKCVGPFSVGRKKRSPIFLNSNQVTEI